MRYTRLRILSILLLTVVWGCGILRPRQEQNVTTAVTGESVRVTQNLLQQMAGGLDNLTVAKIAMGGLSAIVGISLLGLLLPNPNGKVWWVILALTVFLLAGVPLLLVLG